ncbi:MAG TPA: patatin-like phospholipase family protein [Arachnia sp.]|nr:patatin-like phospholipase family protein [Arachnia sp.]HMT87438.1 patatin-like phospholipase family protein [Arachnia sp.]
MNTDRSAIRSPYSSPTLDCDIVMKGGITSGVVYPRAVAELARTYRLRSVGGASAGAIAAAAAAAAELGRQTGGFEELDEMPRALAEPGPDGKSPLSQLFQPTRTAAPLFRLLDALDGTEGLGRVVAVATTLLRGFWLAALLGILPGAALVVLSAFGDGVARVAGIIGGALLLLIGLALGIAIGMARRLGRLAGEGYGMCTGMPGWKSGGAPALTPWLHAKIQSLAGRAEGESPVTFGDFEDAGITVRMMTTNLTRHQPMAMPWTSREYFFDPAYLRTLFPQDVVDHMEKHPPRVPTGEKAAASTMSLRAAAGHLRPWPEPRDLPVVVATRMSLSFPLLITAVRLHAVDYTRVDPTGVDPAGTTSRKTPAFSPVWFTDGGLCANLPVHFFDSPLPKHPTFAFNLGDFPPGREKSGDQSKNSYLPGLNQGGAQRPWFPLGTSGLGAMAGFGMLMVHTAREWVDGEQLIMPGYRDRIVTVFHDDSEGGLNLNMAKEDVTNLAERGRQGAVKLVEAFAGENPGATPAAGWDNHRWIRFRTSTAGLSAWLTRFRDGYRSIAPGSTPYSDFAGTTATRPLPSYRPKSDAQRALINQRTADLAVLADTWAGDGSLATGAPRPRPRLRLVPDDGTAEGLSPDAP